jgi:hypothetical protein
LSEGIRRSIGKDAFVRSERVGDTRLLLVDLVFNDPELLLHGTLTNEEERERKVNRRQGEVETDLLAGERLGVEIVTEHSLLAL